MRTFLVGMIGLCLVPVAACGARPAPAPVPSPPVAAAQAAPSPSSVRSPPAPRVWTVVLDPGHNGGNASHPEEINRWVPNGRGGSKACNTTGTVTDDGYPEHAFTWDVALRIRDALTARGVHVVLTRPDDTGVGPCVDERAAVANRAGADAMVSIHADGAPGGRGFHVAYSDPPVHPSQGAPSLVLARSLVAALFDAGFAASNYRGDDGLDPRDDLAGLNHAEVPAALVECANMRNPDEAALLTTAEGRARYAAAITEGILRWLASSSAREGGVSLQTGDHSSGIKAGS